MKRKCMIGHHQTISEHFNTSMVLYLNDFITSYKYIFLCTTLLAHIFDTLYII